MAVWEIRVDRGKTLAEEPGTGHNRWHPDIAPALRCQPGDEVILDTRDAFDGQMGPDASLETVAAPNLDVVHPLTGPVYVEGAEPGDLLEVEILDVEPDRYGYTVQVPGFGFLRDAFPEPFKVNWDIGDGWATSADLPGVRIPGRTVHGHHRPVPRTRAAGRHDRPRAGPAGARRLRAAAVAGLRGPRRPRHRRGRRCGPSRPASRPATSTSSSSARARACSSRWTPPGALFSAGDAHFAQGDCETCGTAIEMNATLHVLFGLRKGEAAQKNIRDLRFTRQDYYLPPQYAAPRRLFATTGISVTKDGVNHSEDVTLAARNAVLNMIDHLTERGWTRQQAYAICSVAVDLKISQLVDAPNMLVSAFLPEDIFTG